MELKQNNGRWNHAEKLWKSAFEKNELPQFDRFLSGEFAKNSKYGSKDRRWYSDILFAGIRHGYFALFCLEYSNKVTLEKNIQNFEKKYATPKEIFVGLKNAPVQDFFSWVQLRSGNEEISFAQQKKDLFLEIKKGSQLKNKMLFHSVPLWFDAFLEKRFSFSKFAPEKQDEFFLKLDSRPPLWLRLNHLEKRDLVLSEFSKEKYVLEESVDALNVTGQKGIFTLPSYQSGLFEIQDLASQQIGKHVQCKGKQTVWDACAGGGGKTMQIASMLQNKGAIYASDIREYKLEEVKKRAKRAGFFNIRCLPWHGKLLPDFPKEIQLRGGFDWVLVDAPCSSTGTWRRNPDAKYRVYKENLEELKLLQTQILQNASQAVCAGGHLVYSTCSWLWDENEGIVEEFLKQNPQFQLKQQNMLGSPFDNADTMFAAVLQKIQT